ncbi:ABC transporter substrate-binding protein [Microvirga sp. 17 mud 1-3]|uniref:ABC transporter substrate-binding protein n=1 Tax=Microvirga sp. 17 mud 1-3 TaxID=2082949 RepID=UPI000D6AC6C1|nr:ABC transporter substrate-binding protein [Microvirga sp. 17 mud 1-3]AWM87984.1 peptide ABC transporter substrate-binding protein [Microvirga sp. 17 mud 1-3]
MNKTIVAAFGAALVTAAPAAAQSVTVALNADIRSTNPGVNRDDNTDAVVLHMVEGLVGYRENGTVAPLLAESVSLSPDGKTYTFRLRKGVKFHNGADLTAEDVLWSWNRYMDPKTDWRCRSDFDGRSGLKVEKVEATDPLTVTMTLDRASALFLDSMARTDCGMTAILHKSSAKEDGSWDKPVGTGPFKFGEWRRGEFVTLTRFDEYQSPPGDKPDGLVGAKRTALPEVKFLVVPDASTVKAALVSGAVDVAQVLDTDVPELKKAANVEVGLFPSATKHTFLFQTRDPLLGNVKLRQAIAASIDMPQLVAAVSNGNGRPNNSAVAVTSAYYADAQRKGYTYDPAKAQQLLKEAGYKGEPIKIIANKRVHVPSFNAAVIAQAMMQAVGINAEIEVLEWATQLDRYNKGNYQMMSFSYSARLDPALSYEQFSGPKDKQPRKVWDDAETEVLITKASEISDQAERQKIFDELHRRQMEATPLIIFANGQEAWAHTKRVQGADPWEGKPRVWGARVVAN